MKKSYIMWNKDSVTDDKILMDIEEMTKGKIQCSDMQLAETKDILFRSKKKISPVPENLQRRKFQKPDDRSKQQR
jgi:hypothetical protein